MLVTCTATKCVTVSVTPKRKVNSFDLSLY
jgi:hypothetical protein